MLLCRIQFILLVRNQKRIGGQLLIDILNPERIVIGSIYARAEKWFKDTAWRVIEEEALVYPRNVCSVVPAKLGDAIGDMAALTVAINGLKEEE